MKNIRILFFTSIFSLLAVNLWAQDITYTSSESFDSLPMEKQADFLATQNGHADPDKAVITSTSTINWTKSTFSSDINLDVIKSGIPMPSGKASSVNKIEMELPVLIKDPLLSIYVDDANNLCDLVLNGQVTLEQLTRIIDKSQQKPAVFSEGGKKLLTSHTLKLEEIGALLVKHRTPYTQQTPIKTTASRAYTGIVIDARGTLPVHGEFVSSTVDPCIFPKVWNENMDLVYEKNMVDPEIARAKRIVHYSSSKIISEYEDRVGKDPLWITAKKVYGTNRVDPVISNSDYLKITSVKQNMDLIKKGKVVILLNQDALVHKVTAPDRNKNYFRGYLELKQFLYDKKIPDVALIESPVGISITMQNLNFKPDSAELLPDELPRIFMIAESLQKLTATGEYTILVEGHTADVNKPNGQLQLSIERAQSIISLLVEYGVDKNIFTYKGYGGTKPIADNSTPEGRAQNRRVAITAMPKGSYIMAK